MISINPYEIILQIINFGILYFLLRRFLAKPLSSLLSNRANMIKHNIESAELNKRKADELLNEQKEVLKSAQLEAQAIRQKAEDAAENELSSIVETGKESTQKMLSSENKEKSVVQLKDEKTLLFLRCWTIVKILSCPYPNF